MKTIGIIGYGVLGKQIHHFLSGQNISKILIFDDVAFKEKIPDAFPFFDFNKDVYHHANFIVGLGYRHLDTKRQIIEELKLKEKTLFNVIHPSSYIDSTASIGKGVVIFPMVNIDQGVVIQDGVLIHNSSIISHDTFVGASTYISPGVCISGNVIVNNSCFIGSGTVISNGIEIGKSSKIGLGSVVTCNLPDKTNAIGNPLKILSKELNLL